MNKSLNIILGLLLTSASYSVNVSAESKPSPYTDCGIGAALFKNDTGAVISNVIWDLGTTAITSATASPDTCEDFNPDAAAFILDSYDRLVEDTARGQGKHLDTLLSIVDVDDTNKAAVIDSVRMSMAIVVADEKYLEADKIQKANYYYYSLMGALKV